MQEENPTHELIRLTQRLLDSITAGDWQTYDDLCDASLTAFEPEARGHLVQGMDFHRFYFDLQAPAGPANTTISSPHVRLMGDNAAVVSYVRLIQRVDEQGNARTVRFEETRVWQRIEGRWQHVHFHRSAND
jgi:calcium/calmodulin-dependent protein kinase (CaM kinase) II